MKKLPVEDRTLCDAQCLNPSERTHADGSERASRLAGELIGAIGEENARKLFDFNDDFTKHSMRDELKRQYKCYQLEKLSDDFNKLPAEDKKRRPQRSYWKEAYGQLLIDIDHVEKEFCGVDEYWYKVTY